MSRRFASLVLLLLSVCARAQTARVTPGLTPIYGAPALGGLGSQLALSPLALTPLSAASLTPSLAPALAPSALAPALTAAPVAAEVSLSALDVTLSAAAQPASPVPPGPPDGAKSPALRPATPVDGWASRFNFQPGEQFFDGGRPIKSETGATFAAVRKDDGQVRVHIVERAPLAAPKAVPGTEGLAGKELLGKLNEITGRGYKQHEYNEASDYLFSKADHVTVNGVSGVIDAYSGIFVPGNGKDGGDYPEPGDSNGDGFPDKAGMNVEHTWPQSLFQKALPMRSDLHHLMATFMHPNSVRGNLPFGEVKGNPDYENKAGAKRGGGVFEPPDAVKGRVARGMLYFYSRYKDSRMFGRTSVVFWNQQIELFLKWNRQFPPDAFEARRNDLVEQWQGNRNPFIDDYQLADRVGAAAFRAGGPSGGGPGVRSFGRPASRR